ncbi:hypothetical protein JXO59_12905 [candidate division KSB1 bacterium]|nr:hypothetical protein [candidate division KSB1 bacterium]
MKTWFVNATLFGLLFLSSATVAAIGFTGTTAHITPAYTATKGSLYFATHGRVYFKDELETRRSGMIVGETYWLLQGGFGLIYGFNDHLEFGLDQLVYQDTHRYPDGYNLPDDLFFHAKVASFGRKQGNVRFGAQLDIRFPVGKEHNLVLEPYASDRLGWGLQGLFSIISEPQYPDAGININVNAGYFYHNDLGLRLSQRPNDPLPVQTNTAEWIYGVSFSKSLPEFGFFGELYGRSFAQKPPITAYTRENSIYFSSGIAYRANSWLKLRVALDLRILGGDDETRYDGDQKSYTARLWRTVPNLPGWRLNIGTVMAFRLKRSDAGGQDGDPFQHALIDEVQPKDEEMYKDLIEEKRKTESAENELERIRAERQRMEDLLQRLRKILEAPSKEKPENP